MIVLCVSKYHDFNVFSYFHGRFDIVPKKLLFIGGFFVYFGAIQVDIRVTVVDGVGDLLARQRASATEPCDRIEKGWLKGLGCRGVTTAGSGEPHRPQC